MQDPVLLRLADRRRAAQRDIQRGSAIVERGKAELAECDRFEKFYLDAKPSAASRTLLLDYDSVATNAEAQMEAEESRASVAGKPTLKQAILAVLKTHDDGLESGELLNTLRKSGYPKLLRTSMSPQLSRMRGKEVVNVNGLWMLTENKEAADLI